MRRAAFLLLPLLALSGWSEAASAREAVWASAPSVVSVTVYRDPNRREGQKINRDWPQGFAMISETRTVTLPPGETTIRFDGVAEGMVAVSAIVTGLPGGTIEKNRNAALLSPASLVDGTLGNRVTVTRTNPATGAQVSEDAFVRTRADGGIVLQTAQGYEAVRCAGLPEKLTFDRVPDGLSAKPVFSVDTRDASGGTYQVTLTYIAWGFDWQAHYVATFDEAAKGAQKDFALRSWLTIVNNNGQDFPEATLLAVAGKLNVTSNFRGLSIPPVGRALSLTCYPIGHTATGSPYQEYDGYAGGAYPPPPAPPPPMYAPMMAQEVVVTAARADMAKDMMATEEALGDLKLYRVPEQITVAAKSMKQVAFLDRKGVKGELQYRTACSPWNGTATAATGLRILLRTKNDKKHNLGVALPNGGITLFEPSSHGDLLVGEPSLRDYAEGQDVDLEIGQNPSAFGQCVKDTALEYNAQGYPWIAMHTTIRNANRHPINVRVELGPSTYWAVRGAGKGLAVRDGQWTIEQVVPANGSAKIAWEQRSSEAKDD